MNMKKKTYIIPDICVVAIKLKDHLLQQSMIVDSNQEVNSNFTREYNSIISDKSVWDEEW
jgi:hypothetical protein